MEYCKGCPKRKKKAKVVCSSSQYSPFSEQKQLLLRTLTPLQHLKKLAHILEVDSCITGQVD